MNNLNRILVLMLISCMSFLTMQLTYGLFSDSGNSTNNIFAAASVFPTPTASPVPAIVINEVSPDGAVTLEWVELYNPTSSSVDVSGWIIEDGNSSDIFPSSSPIPAGGFGVVKGSTGTAVVPGAAVTILLDNANIGSGLNDPGDLVRLKTSSGTVVDQMNYGNDISGIFTSPPLAPGSGKSLARSPNGVDTNTGADWVVDATPSIGSGN